MRQAETVGVAEKGNKQEETMKTRVPFWVRRIEGGQGDAAADNQCGRQLRASTNAGRGKRHGALESAGTQMGTRRGLLPWQMCLRQISRGGFAFLRKHHCATTGMSNLPDRGLWADLGPQLAASLGVLVRICLVFHPRQICLRQIRRGRISPGKLGPKIRQIRRGEADRTLPKSGQADCTWLLSVDFGG
ncbi:hypothetical protein GCM10025785_03980 [Corynebacterium canis]